MVEARGADATQEWDALCSCACDGAASDCWARKLVLRASLDRSRALPRNRLPQRLVNPSRATRRLGGESDGEGGGGGGGEEGKEKYVSPQAAQKLFFFLFRWVPRLARHARLGGRGPWRWTVAWLGSPRSRCFIGQWRWSKATGLVRQGFHRLEAEPWRGSLSAVQRADKPCMEPWNLGSHPAAPPDTHRCAVQCSAAQCRAAPVTEICGATDSVHPAGAKLATTCPVRLVCRALSPALSSLSCVLPAASTSGQSTRVSIPRLGSSTWFLNLAPSAVGSDARSGRTGLIYPCLVSQ